MKAIKLFIVAAVFAIAGTLSSSAQFHFGVQAGVNVNELHFNTSTFDSHNRMGFNVGVISEFTVPVVGVGADLGVRYVRRNSRFFDENKDLVPDNRDYIEIPLNLKYKVSIPVINNICRPFVTTGPSFSFLTSKTAFEKGYKNRKFDTAWNFGFGLELFKKVQVAASYGLGMNKVVNGGKVPTADGKNRYWTVTASYFFK